MSTDWGIAVDLGDAWYPIPLDVDPKEFGAYVRDTLIEEAPEIVGHELHPERAEALAAEFETMAEHAQRTEAYACSLYRPVFDGPMVAMVESHVLSPERGLPLLERVHTEYAALSGDAAVTEVTLPIGEAIRVHHVTGAEGHDTDSAVVESVTYFFEAPDLDIVQHSMTWTASTLGEDLVAMADDIARDLAFQ